MMPRLSAFLNLDVYYSLVLSLVVLCGTGLIPNFEAQYSNSLPYRWQTEALLHGRLALSEEVSRLDWDHAYGRSGDVQQIWGLAVPIWRLPFEALAKLAGLSAF